MARIWSDGSQYERWRQVELAVLEARAELGELDWDVVAAASVVQAPSAAAVTAIEAVSGHDVAAFIRAWTAPMRQDVAAWVHRDLTSSDVVETAQAMALCSASDLLLEAADALVRTLRDHALVHRRTLRLGRTHGRAAQVDVWGHRVADLALGVARCRDRLRLSRGEVGIAKVSGPVGTYVNLDPRIETRVAMRLGLEPAAVATQVVLRDGLSAWVAALAVISSVCEAVALEVRHGQREEVAEVFEPFGDGQVGSSSMPHKRNPVASERVCGLARVVRSLVVPIMEGVALWHERDISHSSVERICLPQAASLTEFQLRETVRIMAGLVVNENRMRQNLSMAGATVFSAELLTILVEQGVPRDVAHELLSGVAQEPPGSYADEVRARALVMGVILPETDLHETVMARVTNSVGLDRVFERLARL